MEEVEELTDTLLLDKLARELHKRYCEGRRAEGQTVESNPALVPFDELPADLKAANYDGAATIPRKLARIDYGLRPAPPGSEAALLTLSEDQIIRLAKAEHARWNWQKILHGWRYKPGEKDLENKTTPYLVPWNDLPPNIQEYDLESASMIPRLIRDAGYEAFELNGN
jgi:hypothetical protein